MDDSGSTSVLCPKCKTENEYSETDIHYTSFGTHILCSCCEEEVIVKEDDSESPSSNKQIIEEPMDVDHHESYAVEKEVQKTGARRRSHARKLKASASCAEGMNVSEHVKVQLNHSMSTSDIAPMESNENVKDTLTASSLKQLSARLKLHPCLYCNCDDRSSLKVVDKDVYHCLVCDGVYGIDDSMNYFDFQEFLESKYQVDPCLQCGNCDPDEFVLDEVRSVSDDGKQKIAIVIRCKCCSQVQSKNTLGSDQNAAAADVSFNPECSSCKNKDPDQFEIHSDTRKNAITTVCKNCKEKTEADVGDVTGQTCSCVNASMSYNFDEYGYISEVKCDKCGALMKTNEQMQTSEKLLTQDNGASSGRTRIKSLDMIKGGDHIAWHQTLGYWHHAIVIEVQYSWINIIHYNGPGAHKGEIVNEWQEMDPNDHVCYRINYKPEVRSSTEDVIKRAKTRVGEHSYNLLTNNCEHFARWCVTGKHCSYQVQAFYKTILNRAAVTVQGRVFQPLAKLGYNIVKTTSRRTLELGSRALTRLFSYGSKTAQPGVQMATGEAKCLASSVAPQRLAAAFAVAFEIYSVSTDIAKAHHDRVNGAIDRKEFVRITIKRTCEGAGSLAGTAVVLAIPIANNIVGLTLGNVIGKGVGGFLGRNATRLVDMV